MAKKNVRRLDAARPNAMHTSTTTSTCMVDLSGEKENVASICGPNGFITGRSGEQC